MRGPIIAIVFAVQAALLWFTARLAIFGEPLGGPVWHHNASLAIVLLATAIAWKPMTRSRATLAIGILLTTFLATVSAFVLLYSKQELKAFELKDWLKFWHIFWSWQAMVFFFGHTWVNRKPLLAYWRRLHQQFSSALAYDGALLVIVLALVLTWGPWHSEFTQSRYIPWTLWTWLVLLIPAYGSYWVSRLTGNPTGATAARFVNVWLFPMAILANVSGIPITYFDTKNTAWKYVAKYWHTWPSIAFAILVFAHSLQRWPAFMHHWRKFGRRLGQ